MNNIVSPEIIVFFNICRVTENVSFLFRCERKAWPVTGSQDAILRTDSSASRRFYKNIVCRIQVKTRDKCDELHYKGVEEEEDR